MSDEDVKAEQLNLLKIYRRTLTYLREQAAQHGGERYAPVSTRNGIYEARDHIRELKEYLRTHGVYVPDEPGDVESFSYAMELEPPYWQRPPVIGVIISLILVIAFIVYLRIATNTVVTPPIIKPTVIATSPAVTPSVTLPTQQPTSCAQQVAYGSITKCIFPSTTETHSYTFYANAGDRVFVQVARDDGFLEPAFEILDGTGQTVCFIEKQTWRAEQTCSLDKAGPYLINITNPGAYGGHYLLYIQRLNASPMDTALPMGVPITKALTLTAQFDTYYFDVVATEQITITVDQGTSIAGGDLIEPLFVVYAPDGTQVEGCGNDDPNNAKDTCQLSVQGKYTLLITDRRHVARSTYTLTVRRGK